MTIYFSKKYVVLTLETCMNDLINCLNKINIVNKEPLLKILPLYIYNYLYLFKKYKEQPCLILHNLNNSMIIKLGEELPKGCLLYLLDQKK